MRVPKTRNGVVAVVRQMGQVMVWWVPFLYVAGWCVEGLLLTLLTLLTLTHPPCSPLKWPVEAPGSKETLISPFTHLLTL